MKTKLFKMYSKPNMKKLYDKATSAKVGSVVTCPFCGTPHKKSTYHKKFCTNRKTVGNGNCKDRYWKSIK